MKIIRFFLWVILIGLSVSCNENTENNDVHNKVSIPNTATMEYPLGVLEEQIFVRITQEPAHASLSETVNAGGNTTYYYKAMEDYTGMDYVTITFYSRYNDGTIVVTNILSLEITVTEPYE
ncbi:MAG: hypothetical protein LUG51_11220 [Tannerellaceae bacterium]|nr:hypothetical protein [Tannerellaceae bacterium]